MKAGWDENYLSKLLEANAFWCVRPAAIVGYSHVSAITLTHQFAAFRASSASPVGVPPIIYERLCHHVLACVFIPLVKIEWSKLVQLLLTEELLVCAAHCLGKSSENWFHCCHNAIWFYLPFVDQLLLGWLKIMLHSEGVMAIHTRFCLQNTTRMVWRFFCKATPWPCKDKTEPLPSQQNYYRFPEVYEWNPPITGQSFQQGKV